MPESSLMKLIATILTKNESSHIVDCIESVNWADEVLVSDSFSDDNTVQLAQDAGATITQRPFDGWAGQRNAALDTAAELGADWVFFVDADERASPELAGEIRQVIEERPEAGWWIPRRNYIVGKLMNHGGFYPDYQLRLLQMGRGRYDPGRPVHEVVLLDGSDGHLTIPLTHYNYANWQQFHEKQGRYAAFEAQILSERGIKPRPHNFILQPLREFRRRYLTLQGYRDGLHGLKICLLLAFYYGFLPYWLMLREKPSAPMQE
ncbi:MAG: glycosyltransferase family 2 protein [Chloroflexota bacterium]|nr:glycosyltransferase family 2 protein [Chloroflexota bacterium]